MFSGSVVSCRHATVESTTATDRARGLGHDAEVIPEWLPRRLDGVGPRRFCLAREPES